MRDMILNPMLFHYQPIHMDPLAQQVVTIEGLWHFQVYNNDFLIDSISWSWT